MAGIGWVENVRGRGRRELGWEETVVQLEGVLGEVEVWRRKFEQREGKRHLNNRKEHPLTSPTLAHPHE